MRVSYAVTFFATAFFTVAVVAHACKDAEAALAELKILKYRGVDALFVVSGYNSLEAVLFQLGRHSKTENIERLTQLKDTFRRLQNN